MSTIIKEGYTIRIPLPEECGYKGYFAKCTYKYIKSKGKYLVSIWLNYDGIDDCFKIDSQEIGIELIEGSRETIEENIWKLIMGISLDGGFDRYVERFEYTYECCQRGNEMIELERMGLTGKGSGE